MIVTSGASISKVFTYFMVVKNKEVCLRNLCKGDLCGNKLISVGCYPPKLLFLASLCESWDEIPFKVVVL
jgi:hypothetical protein